MPQQSLENVTFYTSAQVAEKLQFNQQVVVRKLQTGEIPGYKIGKDWRISDQQLATWLESRSNQNRLDERAKAERAFFKNGRLVEIPAQRKKRVYILERLLEQFDPAKVYPESEVNEILRRFHSDVCTLRREFILEKMMVRSGGKYKRAQFYSPRKS